GSAPRLLCVSWVPPIFLEEIILRACHPSADTGGSGRQKRPRFGIFLSHGGERVVHRHIVYRNHESVESLEQRRPSCLGAAGGAGISRIAPHGAPVYEK